MDKKGRGTDTKTLYKEKLSLNNLKKKLKNCDFTGKVCPFGFV